MSHNTRSLFSTARTAIAKLEDRVGFLAPALLRLTLGTVFVVTGWGKLHNLDNVTEFFTGLGIPFPALNARVVALTELVGGLLVLVGLGARLASLPLAFTMLIAILTAKRAEVEGLSSLLGFPEWSYLVMFLVIALRGPGALSLDALLVRLFAAHRPAPAALPTPPQGGETPAIFSP